MIKNPELIQISIYVIKSKQVFHAIITGRFKKKKNFQKNQETIGYGYFHRNRCFDETALYNQATSQSFLPTHPVLAFSILLIRRFASRCSTHSSVYRLAPMFAKASELNRPVLFCLYLAGTIDTWRATGATMPPLARSIYRSRDITCEPAMFAIACAWRAWRACLRSPTLLFSRLPRA